MENDKYFYTVYYKGENESPFIKEDEYWKGKYWNYEKDYFLSRKNPEEEDFKNYMIGVINHIADYFMCPFEKILKEYFNSK